MLVFLQSGCHPGQLAMSPILNPVPSRIKLNVLLPFRGPSLHSKAASLHSAQTVSVPVSIHWSWTLMYSVWPGFSWFVVPELIKVAILQIIWTIKMVTADSSPQAHRWIMAIKYSWPVAEQLRLPQRKKVLFKEVCYLLAKNVKYKIISQPLLTLLEFHVNHTAMSHHIWKATETDQ